MNESYWKNFNYYDYVNSKMLSVEGRKNLSELIKNKGRFISDVIFKDPNVLKLVKYMPKEKKHSLLDFETSKPFRSMSMTTISKNNLISLEQLYGDSLFKNLTKNTVYITFDNLGLSTLVLMALYAQYYQNNSLANFFRVEV